jgi:hypothetical protein
VGVLDGGAVSFDSSSKVSVTYECMHHGLNLKLIANGFNYNGDMHIYVNEIDYAYFTTGVAFLVLDQSSDAIIDAATFDTIFRSDAKRYSFADQMAIYEKFNEDNVLDKALSNKLIYVESDEIPVFYEFIKNNPYINRDELYSDEEKTVGELTFQLSKLSAPTILTTHPKIFYRNKNPLLFAQTYYYESLICCTKSLDIVKKIYREGNLADENRIGIFFARATGDVYYTLTISKFYEKLSGKKPVFINRECHRAIFDLFSDYGIEYVLLSNVEFYTLWFTNDITQGAFCLKYNIWDYYNAGNLNSVIGKGWYNGICAALKIPSDESNKKLFIRPVNQTCDREMYVKRDGIIPGKTVLLAPESLSEPMLPFQFWNGLQSVLERRGFKCLVMAYMDATEHSMKGPFVKIPYCDVIDYVQACGYVVAKRSGFVDVISSAKVSLTTLSCDINYFNTMDILKEGLRLDSDGYYNNIFIDEKRIADRNDSGYAMGIIQNILKFTE